MRSIHADWERGDFRRIDWADPEIEFAFADGPEPARWTGVAGMAEGWTAFLKSWADFRAEPTEYIVIDEERILVLLKFSGRARASGLELDEMQTKNASLAHLRDGKVAKLTLYWDRDRALADLGLAPEGDSPS